MYLDLFFGKSLPWRLDIHGLKLSLYHNIFLSQYCVEKIIVCISPIHGINSCEGGQVE